MRRKVVFVNRFFYPDLSATSQMLSDLAMRLAADGMEVHVICSRQLYEDAAAALLVRERVRGVEIHRVWTARFGRASLRGRALDYASFYLSATQRLCKLLRAGDVAVIKTDPPLLSVCAAPVVALRRAQLVNWLQDVFPEIASRMPGMRLPQPVEAVLQGLRDRTLAFAKANVVLGARMRDYLTARGIRAAGFHIIENWADSSGGSPKSIAQSTLRARLGLSDKFVVGYSGNLGRAHDFETIANGAEALREDPDIAFLMIGGGAKMQALRARVAERGLTSFHFLPYQPRGAVEDSLAAADVHLASLLPQLEGLIVPSKVYGILAAGRPVVFIGAEDGEIARLLQDNECGTAVACGDAERLAGTLRQMKSDPARTREQGHRARALFDRRFTLDRAVSSWNAMLTDLQVSLECKPPAQELPPLQNG